MKLNKSSWILIIAGIVLIGGLVLGTALMQQSNQQQDLTANLAQARQKLVSLNNDSLTAQKAQLTQQITQYNPQIDSIKTQLSFDKDSIDTTNTLLADAQTSNVTIQQMNSSGISTTQLNGTTFKTLSVSISAQGTTYDIVNFIDSLTKVFPTSEVTSVQLGVSGQNTQASFNLVIYGYGG